MNLNELYPSRFMKAAEFGEGEVRIFTIKDLVMETLGQGDEKENKPILSFREPGAKDLVLNKTNAMTIGKLYGDDTDEWIGKKIGLFATEVQSFGETVLAIRVKVRAPAAVPSPVSSGVTAPGVQIPSKKARAEIKTSKWKPAVDKAIELGFVPDDSEKSGYRLLQVVGNAGISVITDDNVPEAFAALVAHYAPDEEPVTA